LLRFGLAALFVYAGAVKLGDPATFAEEIANYRLVPQLAPWLAAVLPMMELATGVTLALAPALWRSAAAILALALLTVFTIAVTAAWFRGIDVRCGCFGKGGGPIDGWTVARDVLFVMWAAVVLRATFPSSTSHE
jgi:hypothetical protein